MRPCLVSAQAVDISNHCTAVHKKQCHGTPIWKVLAAIRFAPIVFMCFPTKKYGEVLVNPKISIAVKQYTMRKMLAIWQRSGNKSGDIANAVYGHLFNY